MKLKEITKDGSAYLMVIHTISKKKFEIYFETKESEHEIWLNDHSLEYRGTKLPYENYVSGLVQNSIDMGAEGLIIKKGKQMIINEQDLLEDSLGILTEHYGVTEKKAKRLLNEDVMAKIVNEMYTAQESYIAELHEKIRRSGSDTEEHN